MKSKDLEIYTQRLMLINLSLLGVIISCSAAVIALLKYSV